MINRKCFSIFILSFCIFQPASLLAETIAEGYGLIGVIRAHRPEESIAVIATPEKKTVFLHVGDQLPGSGMIKLKKIKPRQVLLSDGTSDLVVIYQGSRESGAGNAGTFRSDASSEASVEVPRWEEPEPQGVGDSYEYERPIEAYHYHYDDEGEDQDYERAEVPEPQIIRTKNRR